MMSEQRAPAFADLITAALALSPEQSPWITCSEVAGLRHLLRRILDEAAFRQATLQYRCLTIKQIHALMDVFNEGLPQDGASQAPELSASSASSPPNPRDKLAELPSQSDTQPVDCAGGLTGLLSTSRLDPGDFKDYTLAQMIEYYYGQLGWSAQAVLNYWLLKCIPTPRPVLDTARPGVSTVPFPRGQAWRPPTKYRPKGS